MDGLVQKVFVEVVVDYRGQLVQVSSENYRGERAVLLPEAPCRTTGAHIAPIIVVVCDVEVTRVEFSEGRVVANEGGLVVVVEVVPRHRDVV